MRAITRYVMLEMLKVFTVTLAGLTLLLVLVGVIQEAIRMNLSVGPTLRLLPYVLPNALAFAIPAAILFTVCMVYGRMSADNEVVALKSLGISPAVILMPGLVLAFILSLVAVWLNDVAFSWGHAGIQRVVLQSVEEIAYGMLRSQRSYANPRFSIIVKEVQGRELIHPIMNFQANKDLPAFTVTAEKAELESNLAENTLRLILTNCIYESGSTMSGVLPGRTVQEIPLSFASSREIRGENPAHLSLRRIPGEVVAQQARIEGLQQAMAAEVGFSLVTGDFDNLSEEVWAAKRKTLADARARLNRLHVERWRRWAAGFCCLAFVMIGIPVAVRLRRSDVMSTFGLCFLPILLIYYPFLAYGLDAAKAGTMPPYIVWGANLVCMAIGWWQIRQMFRY